MLCSELRRWHDSVAGLTPDAAQVEEALSFLQAAGLSGAAKYAAGTVLCCVDEAQKIPLALEREAELVLLRVAEAWQKLVSLPPGEALRWSRLRGDLPAVAQLAVQGVSHLALLCGGSGCPLVAPVRCLPAGPVMP